MFQTVPQIYTPQSSPSPPTDNMLSVPSSTTVPTGPNGQPKPRKMRASCDACSRAKVKCDKVRPTCQRCGNMSICCNYSPSMRYALPPSETFWALVDLHANTDWESRARIGILMARSSEISPGLARVVRLDPDLRLLLESLLTPWKAHRSLQRTRSSFGPRRLISSSRIPSRTTLTATNHPPTQRPAGRTKNR